MSRASCSSASAGICLALALLFISPACAEMPDPRGNLPHEGGCEIVQGDTSENPSQYAAFVATTDFTINGGFGVIDLGRLCTWSPDPMFATQVVSPDPLVKAYGDHVYVINRHTYDSISVLNKGFGLEAQYSVADPSCDPSNPHDLEFASRDKAYLSRYECRDLWVINPVTGDKLGSIDLATAGYGGADGIPEMSGMLLHGRTLYVAVQMMDRSRWEPEGPGKLVLIDTGTDTVAGEVALAGKNPVTDISYSPALDSILVYTAGDHTRVGDGGIEGVRPGAAVSDGYIIDEAALGGNVGDFVIAAQTRGYATITTADFESLLVRFDPSTGARDQGSIYSAASGFSLWDIALSDRLFLYVCDRSAARPGVVVIDTMDNDTVLTPKPIDLGLPPFSITFMR